MNVSYRVTLSPEERAQLQTLVNGGKGKVRRLKRAQILLAASRARASVGGGSSTLHEVIRGPLTRTVVEGFALRMLGPR